MNQRPPDHPQLPSEISDIPPATSSGVSSFSEQPASGGTALEDDPAIAGYLGSRRRRYMKIGLWVLGLILILWFIPPVWKLRFSHVTVTRWDRKQGETQAVVGPGQKGWISPKKISRHALHAIVAAEDGKFYSHSGFDLAEIAESVRTNLRRKRYVRGGSTISQQVVKMAFLGREKSLIRKTREAIGTLIMEGILSKEEILAWYINLAEFGDGVYGIQEGCWHYFKTKPELLSIEQSVHLALVLPSPNGWSKGLRQRRLTAFGHRRFASILNRMLQSGYITRTQWITALSRGDFGRPVGGYSRLVANESAKKPLCPGDPSCPDNEEVEEDLPDQEEELSYPPPGRTSAQPVTGSSQTLNPAATSVSPATPVPPMPAGTTALPPSGQPQQSLQGPAAPPDPTPVAAPEPPPSEPDTSMLEKPGSKNP